MPKPTLPDGYELPDAVGGWHYDPADTSNGHIWRSDAHGCSVGVFDNLGSASVRVRDDRVDGFGANIDLEQIEYDRDESDALREAIAAAREWMDTHSPAEWSHPDVCEAVFETPPGCSLVHYYLENRTAEVYYRREGVETGNCRTVKLEGPDTLTRENAPYLYVHVWNGSGKATVALAPWTCAHGPGSKHLEVKPVADAPDDCGLEVAVTVVREWVREDTGEIDTDASGQAGLGRWSA